MSSFSPRASGRNSSRAPSEAPSDGQQSVASTGSVYTPIDPKSSLLRKKMEALRAKDEVATPIPSSSKGPRDTWCEVADDEKSVTSETPSRGRESVTTESPIRVPGTAHLTRDQMAQRQTAQQKLMDLSLNNQILKDQLIKQQKGNAELKESLKAMEVLEREFKELDEDYLMVFKEYKEAQKDLEEFRDILPDLRREKEAVDEALEEAVDSLFEKEKENAALHEKILHLEASLKRHQATDSADSNNDSGYYSHTDSVHSQSRREDAKVHLAPEQVHVSSKAFKRLSLQAKTSTADLNKRFDNLEQRRDRKLEPLLEPQDKGKSRADTPAPRAGEPSLARRKAYSQLRHAHTAYENPRTAPNPPSDRATYPFGQSFKERALAVSNRDTSSSHPSSSRDVIRAPPSDRTPRPPAPQFERASDRDPNVSYGSCESKTIANRDSVDSFTKWIPPAVSETSEYVPEPFDMVTLYHGDGCIDDIAKEASFWGSSRSGRDDDVRRGRRV